MTAHNLIPVLSGAGRMRDWAETAAGCGRRLPYHVKVDVGLGRMGSLPGQGTEIAQAATELAGHIELRGISSHLSAPEAPSEHNEEEARRFQEFCEPFTGRFPGLERHLAASQAAARFRHLHYELVRIGGLIYGLEYVPSSMKLKPVLTFKTKVAQVKTLPPGWHVGYGLRHRVERPTTMGLLPLGWTDGFFGSQVGKADVLIGGQFRRLIGSQGDLSISAIEFGARGGVSTGQLFGKISLRVPRLFSRHGRPAGELSILQP